MEEKFKELAMFVDLEARGGVSCNVTKSQIKCMCGFNPCGLRDKIINKHKSDQCPRCIEKEDWDHVIKCAATKSMRDEFRKNLIKDVEGLIKKEKIEGVEWEVFLEDIIKYLNGNNQHAITHRFMIKYPINLCRII